MASLKLGSKTLFAILYLLSFQEHGYFLDDLQRNLSISAMLIAGTFDLAEKHGQSLSETQDLLGKLDDLTKGETYSIRTMLCKVHVAIEGTGVPPTNTSNLNADMIQLPLTRRLGRSNRFTASVGGRILLSWVMQQTEVMKSRVEQQLTYLLDRDQESRRVTREVKEFIPSDSEEEQIAPPSSRIIQNMIKDGSQTHQNKLSKTDIKLYMRLSKIYKYASAAKVSTNNIKKQLIHRWRSYIDRFPYSIKLYILMYYKYNFSVWVLLHYQD